MKRQIVAYILVLLAAVVSVRMLFQPGFYPMHDDTQIARVVTMGHALLRGQFPVRWVSDLGYGYGYPIYNFYGPLPYYVGGGLYALGMSGIAATKGMIFISSLFAAVFMFALLRRLVGNSGAVVGTVFFLFAPYRAVNIFVRGAVGEAWAISFFPLLLLGLVLTYTKKRRFDSSVIGGLGLAGIIISHTLLGYTTVLLSSIGLGIVWVYEVFTKRFERSRMIRQVGILLFGLLLSAFFWLPAFAEKSFTNVDSQVSLTADYHNHFVCPEQLWYSPWGFGGSAAGCTDGLSFSFGKITLLTAVLGVVLTLLYWRKVSRRIQAILVVGIVIAGISVFLTTSWSLIIWENVPNFAYLQYPWRFLGFTGFGLSLLAGLAVLSIKNPFRLILGGVLVTAIIVRNGSLFTPQFLIPRGSSFYESPADIRYRVSKISDEYLPQGIVKPQNPSEVVRETVPGSSSLTVGTEIDTETYVKAILLTKTAQDIRINRAFFPGWEYRVNGNIVTPKIEQGLPVLTIPGEDSTMQMFFRDTPIRRLSNVLTLGAIIILLFYYGRKTIA